MEDICRFPAALKAIIEAKGAKVAHLDNRRGRRQSKPYQPPRSEAVEELTKARYERFDPTPVEPQTNPLPPKSVSARDSDATRVCGACASLLSHKCTLQLKI